MLKFIKNWALPLAMVTGALGYPLFSVLSPLTPYLIFAMLILTFSKIDPKELRPSGMHFWLLFLQIPGSIAVYYAIAPLNAVVAQAAMVCVIAPTATAAAVITAKLGGSAASLTTYTLMANIGVAIVAPLFFPLVEANPDLSFRNSAVIILSKAFPLLIFPFIISLIVRKSAPHLHGRLVKMNELAFYLWALSLTIVTGRTIDSLVHDPGDPSIELWMAFAALVACGTQFFLGKCIGTLYKDRISGGQALGQKNMILAIWMAHTYLNPISSVGPGAYVLWQNVFNSWQLWKKRKREEALKMDHSS
ncbi:MAG: transporter [Bacteroides sp.]|nr:transporter [Bacteroides sp.]